MTNNQKRQHVRALLLGIFHGLTGMVFFRKYACATCNITVYRDWKICPKCLDPFDWEGTPQTWREIG